MFDAFMSVFCVLTLEIFKGVIPCVTNEGVRVHGTAHELGVTVLFKSSGSPPSGSNVVFFIIDWPKV